MATSYLTLARGRDADAEVEVKRSRFLAVVRRVGDEHEARGLVTQQRRLHHAARHHCSAYILGPDGQTERSSDDGEPSGTAGVPMLDVLRGRGLSDVAAVVTRYFGGTLLGSGGLVRAYSDAVGDALIDATLVRRTRVAQHRLVVPLAQLGRVEGALRSTGVVVHDVTYGAGDEGTLVIASNDPAAVAEVVASLTSSRPDLTATGEEWVDLPVG